jgi:cell division protein FtsB
MSEMQSETGMRITLISGLMIVAFMAFGLTISVYRMAVFDNSVEQIRLQNEDIKERIALKKSSVEYYRSTQFKDKFAKENLQLVSPGEYLIIIQNPDEDTAIQNSPVDTTAGSSLFKQQLRQIPVYRHWQMYLFNKQPIEQLEQQF